MSKTMQECLEDKNDNLTMKVFVAMVDAGMDPNWVKGSPIFNDWFRTLLQSESKTARNIVKLIIDMIPFIDFDGTVTVEGQIIEKRRPLCREWEWSVEHNRMRPKS